MPDHTNPIPRTHRLAHVAVGYGDGARAVIAMVAWSAAAFAGANFNLVPTRWNDAVFLAWLAGVLVGWGVLMWACVRIGRALGGDAVERRGMVIGSLLPLTSPFFAGVLLFEARNVVRAAGFKLPPWGMERARAASLLPHECCPACLYDLTGVRGEVCPECGRGFVRRAQVMAAR